MGQNDVCEVIDGSKKPLTAEDISRRLKIGKQNIHQSLIKLKKCGWIKCRKIDNYGTKVWISEEKDWDLNACKKKAESIRKKRVTHGWKSWGKRL